MRKAIAMKQLLLLIMFGAAACGREPEERSAATEPAVQAPALPTQTRASRASAVIPLPKDQAQLDRMILAGYTPHSDHLHPPGVNECPMTKGTDAVM